MVEYKSYLKLKIPKKLNILGLTWERYNVISCSYDLWQDTDKKTGEPNSKVKGGTIQVVLSDLPNDALMAWVFDHAKFYNGEITIVDLAGETLEQVYFEEARCVDFDLHYGLDTQFKAEIRLTLNVKRLQIGEAYFENTGL